MEALTGLLKELGISKVKLAKYLGVSRQMVYNYLEMDSLDEWPTDKKTKILILFNVMNEEELKNIKLTNDMLAKIEQTISDSDGSNDYRNDTYSIKNLDRKNQNLLSDIISILKEKLTDEEDAYNTLKYLYYLLQSMNNGNEANYTLAFFAKSTGFVPVNEFVYNMDEQILFEGIMYQATTLYNGKGFSKEKVINTHKKFAQMVEQKKEEELSRTQELSTVRARALKELGYTEINEENATEVFQKIAELQTNKSE